MTDVTFAVELLRHRSFIGVIPPPMSIADKYADKGGSDGYLRAAVGDPQPGPQGGAIQVYEGGTIFWAPGVGAYELHGTILKKYNELGGPAGFLGYPNTDVIQSDSGVHAVFSSGAIFNNNEPDLIDPVAALAAGAGPTSTSHEVHGEIFAKYSRLGAQEGVLGYPRSDEEDVPGGKVSRFEWGSIYYSGQTGAHEVHGDIGRLFAPSEGWPVVGSIGMQGLLGFPTTDETSTPDGGGRFNHFQGGSIYWSPGTGAHAVLGAIRDKWAALGWESGPFGYPVTSETAAADGAGRFNHFQGGSIYWSPGTGAHAVHGAIRDKWAALGWESSSLGYPVTSETPTQDGAGRFNHFQGGSIYWSPRTGAHAVLGGIRERWAALGWQHGPLGYPVQDTVVVTDAVKHISGGVPLNMLATITSPAATEQYCVFEHGFISANPTTGANACMKGTRYVFKMDSFRITETRALYDDTDTVALGLAIDGAPPTSLSKEMGDVDNGTHEVGLAFDAVQLDAPESTACLTYVIVNSGFDDEGTKIAKTVNAAISDTLQTIPIVGSWAPLVEAVMDFLIDLFTANCDGVVAVDKYTLTGWMLNDFTAATGELSPPEIYYLQPDVGTSWKCGGASEYYVTWSVQRIEPE